MKLLVVVISTIICLTCAATANENATNESYTYIFLQQATGGSFVSDGSGNYTLSLTGVIPYTVVFSDRPARLAKFVKMEDFLTGFDFDPQNPPNAAVMIQGANETVDVVVLELTAPIYDAANQTLMYAAKLTSDFEFKSGWANDLTARADPALPEEFEDVALIIDDAAINRCDPGIPCLCGDICCPICS